MKLKAMIEGKEVEVDVENEDVISALGVDSIVESIDTKDKTTVEKLLAKLGIKINKKTDEKTPEEPEKKPNNGNEMELSPEVKALLEKNAAKIEELEKLVQASQDATEKERTSNASIKVEKILSKAVSEGRIAKGEIEKFQKKFDESFKGDADLFGEFVNQRPVDNGVRLQNATSHKPNLDSKGNEVAGIRTFTRSQLRNQEFYNANRPEIKKAEAAGTIIDDISN